MPETSEKKQKTNRPSVSITLQPEQEQWELTSCVRSICASSQVRLMLLKHKMEKEAVSFSTVLPIKRAEKKAHVLADRKRNGIYFTLTLAQQSGSD